MEQEFVKQCKNLVAEMIKGVHTALPAQVLAFNPQTGLAAVQPLAQNGSRGNRQLYPPIYGVPVVFPQSCQQQATIAFPLQAGDGCLLIMAEQALDYWLYGQETETELPFDLSNALAIPGLFNCPSEIMAEACREQALILQVQNQRLKITAAGLSIQGDLTVEGEIKAAGDVIAKYDIPEEKVSLLGE